jgi:hypothetical protein
MAQRLAKADGSSFDPTRKANGDKIICPVLASLYMNGDLRCTEDGVATVDDLVDAIQKTGLSGAVSIAGIRKFATSITGEAGSVNVFKMDGNARAEHTVSTGARDPGPNATAFEKLASFADEAGRMYAAQATNMVNHFTKNPNDRNPQGLPGGVLGAYGLLVTAFGRDEQGDGKGPYMTVDDLRGMYLEGKYPKDWVVREWGLFDAVKQIIRIKTALWWIWCCCSCCSKKSKDEEARV